MSRQLAVRLTAPEPRVPTEVSGRPAIASWTGAEVVTGPADPVLVAGIALLRQAVRDARRG